MPWLTRREANRKRLWSDLIGLPLVILGFPFILWWVQSAPAPDLFDLVVGAVLIFTGGGLLSAAGLNRVGVNWWQDVTIDDGQDDPLEPV